MAKLDNKDVCENACTEAPDVDYRVPTVLTVKETLEKQMRLLSELSEKCSSATELAALTHELCVVVDQITGVKEILRRLRYSYRG